MRPWIAFACLLLLTACRSTTSTRPVAAGKQRIFVSGTLVSGSNLTEPRPRESQFFKTDHAGFVVLEEGAAYYLRARVLKAPPSNSYARIEYENPKDASRPFINDMELTPPPEQVLFTSPDVVWGIRNYANYTIRVTVFPDRESTKPIDTLVQPVRAYVDATTGQVRIYHRIRQRP